MVVEEGVTKQDGMQQMNTVRKKELGKLHLLLLRTTLCLGFALRNNNMIATFEHLLYRWY